MPGWLRFITQINPLTYLIDALRGMMITGGENIHSYAVDFAVMLAAFAMLLFVAVKVIPDAGGMSLHWVLPYDKDCNFFTLCNRPPRNPKQRPRQ